MCEKYLISFLLFINTVFAFTQEPIYFNNIYNPVNTYASGRGILQVDNHYYGIFGTFESSGYWYNIGVFKMSSSGNLIDWNLIGENGYDYFAGSVGGTLIKTLDGNLAFACQVQNPITVFGKLIKLDPDLDTIWTKQYHTDNEWTMTIKVKQASDGGYLLVGNVKPEDGEYYNLLLIRTDNQGNMLWYQMYGGVWSEHGTDVIETPDEGYLIGGYFWKPGYDHSLDAMVIKTDSMGNEEWTQYYGNPDVDDDMALVAMADDGNYLVATIYGEWIHTSMIRTGRLYLVKIDNNGNTIWDKKIGPKRRSINIKNIRHTFDGNLVATGWSYTDTISEWIYDGWIYRFTQEGDSIWWRDYYHYHNQYDRNFFYDVCPTSDNGYIAIGKARPDQGGSTNKMWIVKVDSLGCDTPGCFTTVISEEWLVNSGYGHGLRVWPNPVKNKLKVESVKFKVKSTKYIYIYNSQGLKVEEIKVPDNTETLSVDVSSFQNGLYYLQYIHSGQIMDTVKFIKN